MSWSGGRDRWDGRFIGVEGDKSELRVYCPTDEEPARVVFGTLWDDDHLMPANDAVKVSWDNGEPVRMAYKPTGWRSIMPEAAWPAGDILKARWPVLENAKTFFERVQSAQIVEVTFPDGNQDSYRVHGMTAAWTKTCN